MISINDILDYTPQLTEPKFGPEPSIRKIITFYYSYHLRSESTEYQLSVSQEYIQDLQTHFDSSDVTIL